MRTCKSDHCSKEFEPKDYRQVYCTTSCKDRNSYLKKTKSIDRVCISRDCGKKFTTTNKNKVYCTDKCSKKEIRKRHQDNGTTKKRLKPKIEKTCGYRGCGEKFMTSKKTQKYCSHSCAKKETSKARYEKGLQYSKVKKVQHTCAYRNCTVIFQSQHPNAKFCCHEHAQKEAYCRTADIKNPNRRTNLGVLGKVKEQRFKIPNMSAKWLQKLWDERKTA